MTNAGNKSIPLSTVLPTLAVIFSLSAPAVAVDDGARAYWKARAGTQAVSFQYLRWDIEATSIQQFDPAHYIYPNSDIQIDVFLATYARHFTLFDRPSSIGVSVVGGNVDAEVRIKPGPEEGFLPPGVVAGSSFSQSSSG